MHCERASPKRAVLACRPGVAVGDGGAIDRANKAWHVLRNRACLQINAMGIKLSAVAVKVDQPPCDRPGRSSAVAARARELRLGKPWQPLAAQRSRQKLCGVTWVPRDTMHPVAGKRHPAKPSWPPVRLSLPMLDPENLAMGRPTPVVAGPANPDGHRPSSRGSNTGYARAWRVWPTPHQRSAS